MTAAWTTPARALLAAPEGLRPCADWRRAGAPSEKQFHNWLATEVRAGRAFRVRVSAKNARYFASEVEADAYTKRSVDVDAPVKVAKRPSITRAAAVDDSRAKFTVCPPFVDRRFMPDLDARGRVPGGFEDMGPGRYLGPA